MLSAALLDGVPWRTPPEARHVCEYYERSPEEDEQYSSLYDAIEAVVEKLENGSEAPQYARNGHAAGFHWKVLNEVKEILRDKGDDRYEDTHANKKADENEVVEDWTVDKAKRVARKLAVMGLKYKKILVDEVLTPLRKEHKINKLRKLNDQMEDLESAIIQSHKMKQDAEKESQS